MEFQTLMAEAKKECLWAPILEWGQQEFHLDHLWVGVRVLQVGETSTRTTLILYNMPALLTVCRVFSVSSFDLATTAGALPVAL